MFYRAEKKSLNDDDFDSKGSFSNLPLKTGNYKLVITKMVDCNIDQIASLVHKYVPECSLMADMEEQIIFTLPVNNKNQFGALSSALEFRKENLKFNDIKIIYPVMGNIYPK